MLRLDGVGTVRGSGPSAVRALADVSLEVAPGQLVAVMGPSGSGKSTLLAVAGGLQRPDSGTVQVDGVDLGPLSERDRAALRRRRVGYVFQEANLLPSLTAAENVSLPRELDGVRARTARAEAVEALSEVGVGHLADRFPEQMSGGQQQRVAIARALIGQRRLLLADEPTGALDSATAESVLRLLRRRCRDGAAGLLVTHDAGHAAWADWVVFLRDGRTTDRTAPSPGVESLLPGDVS